MGEQVYLLIGGIPYRGVIVDASNVPDDMRVVELLEDIGKRDVITSSEATTFFSAGTHFCARWDGDTHSSTGERCYRLVPPPGFEGGQTDPEEKGR